MALLTTFDANTTFSWFPLGADIMNSSGFVSIPVYADGVATNYQWLITQQLLGGIVLILVVWFVTWLYFQYTRRINP